MKDDEDMIKRSKEVEYGRWGESCKGKVCKKKKVYLRKDKENRMVRVKGLFDGYRREFFLILCFEYSLVV